MKDGLVELDVKGKPVFANELDILVLDQFEKEKTKPLTGQKNKKVVVSKIKDVEVTDIKTGEKLVDEKEEK